LLVHINNCIAIV